MVDRLLGEGGQGQVWRVRASDGTELALKWYFPASASDDQRAALKDLVRRGAPDRRFLWPLDLVESVDGAPGFGYLMELRSPQYSAMTALMQRIVEPSFAHLARAGAEMADAFLQLHSQGLCYLDISFGNVFLDPTTGGILICDNDNVRIDGRPAGIAGTPRFMAPEVIRDLAAGRLPTPNRSTDLFSLAVLLFYVFVMHHPFEGRKESAIDVFGIDEQNKLYGDDPVFLFDPDDDSNRPDPAVHANPILFWPLYPQFLRDLFVRSFTLGVSDPSERVQESEWRLAMVRLHDAITPCPACGAETFVEGAEPRPCWNCETLVSVPPRLHLGTTQVVLVPGRTLHAHHTQGGRYGFEEPTAEVVHHPDRPEIWGLRNLTRGSWQVTSPDGSQHTVEPGQSARILDRIRIAFGGGGGTVEGSPPGATG